MGLVSWLGGAAAVASTLSFAPQAVKVIRTRRTADISAGMYALTVCAFGLWLAYGAMLGQWPLIASNAICFLLAAFILMMKLLPARKKKAVARRLTPD
jgi:MtN3 and saliva related transmembrane protein